MSRKTKRRDTELPQTSVPIEHVAEEAVNEEMDDSLERATTTATSLDAEQDREITSLKKRVKRFNKKRRSKTHGLKKIIQDCTLVFDANKDLQGEEVIVEKEVVDKDVSVVEEINAASIATSVTATTTTAATTPTISMDEITLAKALIEIKTSRPKANGIVMKEPSETPTPTLIVSSQQPSKVQDKGKGIMVEPEMPLKKKVQISLDEELAFKLQAKKDKQERIDREKAQQIEEVNLAWDDIQAKHILLTHKYGLK
nr:hypothetical protein [Tanacetum cinerariifolium]